MATDGKLLFHLSDIHFGLVDQQAIDWVRREIAEQRPDAVAITGDLTMRARHREFAAATRWIQSLDVPVTVEVGNHDMPYFNLIERFFTPYKRFRGMSEHVEREIDLPGLAIVPLKTAVRAQPRFNWSKGWVTKAALKKCLAAIDALPPGARALVAVHHPLREVGTVGTALTIRGGKALRLLFVYIAEAHAADTWPMGYSVQWPRPTSLAQRCEYARAAAEGMGLEPAFRVVVVPRGPVQARLRAAAAGCLRGARRAAGVHRRGHCDGECWIRREELVRFLPRPVILFALRRSCSMRVTERFPRGIHTPGSLSIACSTVCVCRYSCFSKMRPYKIWFRHSNF